jgi:hypothetical protein
MTIGELKRSLNEIPIIGSNGKLFLPCGGHLGYAIGTKITNLVEDHPVLISIMLQFHRLSSFWQEDFQSFNQSEHIIGPGSHVGFPIYTKITNSVEDLLMNISAKFGPNLFSGFREEDENMKSLQMRTTTDAKWWQKLTIPFGPGELTRMIIGIFITCAYQIFLHQTPSNRIPAALRQTPSDWIHAVLWQIHVPSDQLHIALWQTPSD